MLYILIIIFLVNQNLINIMYIKLFYTLLIIYQ